MKFLFDTVPLLLFLVAIVVYDIKVATGVLIVASIIQVVSYRILFKKFETMHLITLVAVLIFGGFTLLLNDARFLKWKPTVVNWIFTAILLSTQWFGKKPAIQYMMGSQISLPDRQWRTIE